MIILLEKAQAYKLYTVVPLEFPSTPLPTPMKEREMGSVREGSEVFLKSMASS